jgi:hypothetical protein
MLRAATLLAVLAAVPAAGAQTLRYGGEEGRTDLYGLTHTVRIRQEFQDAVTELTMRSRSVLRLALRAAADDTLTYGVTFDSLDVQLEGAALPGPELGAVLGRTMTLRVSPRGRVFAFEVPEDIPQTPSNFDLRQMVSHFLPRLPEGEAQEGTSWTDTLRLPVAQAGIESDITVVTTYTSRGEPAADDRAALGAPPRGDGRLVAVDYATSTTIEGRGEQEGRPLFLDGSGTGSGTILFAEDGRTFWSSTGTQVLEMRVEVSPEGQPPVSIPIRQEIQAEIRHF